MKLNYPQLKFIKTAARFFNDDFVIKGKSLMHLRLLLIT